MYIFVSSDLGLTAISTILFIHILAILLVEKAEDRENCCPWELIEKHCYMIDTRGRTDFTQSMCK